MSRNLLLSGGIVHDFAASSAALAELLTTIGVDTDVVDDPDAAWERLDGYDLLTVNGLRWRMLPDRYAEHRDRWAYSTPPDADPAVRAHLARGGGVLAVHTATICFDDWPGWGEIVGAAWDWDRSSHPPLGPVHVTLAGDGDPFTSGLGPAFDLVDEVYGFLDEQPDLVPLARSAHGGREHPVLWARAVDGGRVACDTLGHDVASLTHPVHATLLRRCAAWALGWPDALVRGVT